MKTGEPVESLSPLKNLSPVEDKTQYYIYHDIYAHHMFIREIN